MCARMMGQASVRRVALSEATAWLAFAPQSGSSVWGSKHLGSWLRLADGSSRHVIGTGPGAPCMSRQMATRLQGACAAAGCPAVGLPYLCHIHTATHG